MPLYTAGIAMHCIVANFATRPRDRKTKDCFWDQTLRTQLLKVVNKDEDTKTGCDCGGVQNMINVAKP